MWKKIIRSLEGELSRNKRRKRHDFQRGKYTCTSQCEKFHRVSTCSKRVSLYMYVPRSRNKHFGASNIVNKKRKYTLLYLYFLIMCCIKHLHVITKYVYFLNHSDGLGYIWVCIEIRTNFECNSYFNTHICFHILIKATDVYA